MSRLSFLILVAVVVAACSAPGTTAVSTPVSASPKPSEAPPPPASATPEPTLEPTASLPAWEGHPAAGLAIVRSVPEDEAASQIFVVEADGTLRQVTGVSGALGASHPVWSPDGEQIAFAGPKIGEPGISGQLAVVNADGSGERDLADGQLPQWSIDAARIAFTEVDDVTGDDLSMYLLDVATGEVTDLGLGYTPRWLGPDRIVFNANTYAADGSASFDAFVLDLPTGERTLLAEGAMAYPSPDRTMLLIVRDGVISLTAADGSGAEELANGVDPVWSPDGSHFTLAYDHDADANPVHAVVDLEGRTISSGLAGATPTWSPDGTRVAVQVYQTQSPIVRVIEVATGEVVWEAEGLQPAWRP